MLILQSKITRDNLLDLKTIGETEIWFDYMVKCVVDIEKQLLAINAELHSDLEELLLDNGSKNTDLYGINIDLDEFEIEYDSMINPPRNREAGYPRAGRTVANPHVREKIQEVVKKWIDI